MDLAGYKEQLLAQERLLSARLERGMVSAREPGDGAAQDVGDESSADELKEEQFAEGEVDRATLTQVREALQRIEKGTFGTCIIDGGPIEEKRLAAMPWTPYCLKHQASLESSSPSRTATM